MLVYVDFVRGRDGTFHEEHLGGEDDDDMQEDSSSRRITMFERPVNINTKVRKFFFPNINVFVCNSVLTKEDINFQPEFKCK